MNSFRLLRGAVAALAVGLLGLGLEGCTKCGPGNCTGCCDANGQCQLAATDHCGANGGACSTCLSVQQCIAGACQFAGSNGSGSGSGSTTATTSSSSSTSGSVAGSSGASSSSTSSTNGGSVTSGSGASSGTTGTCDCTVCTNSGLVCNPNTCTCSVPTSSSSGGTTGSCDCTSCTNAGLSCDTSNCTCVVPTTNTTGTSGTTSTNSSAGTTGTTSTTSTNSSAGTTNGTTTGTTGTTGGGFCSSLGATPTINNGGIGNPCTPNDTQFPDGGSQPTQGSCTTTGQYCYTLFNNDQPRCWSFCTTANQQGSAGGCPGDSYCYDFGATASGSHYLSCQPIGAGNNAGCPSGYVTLFVPSPDPASINLCGPSCTQSSDCNGSGSTQYTCTGGKCHCSNAATDCAPGALCDTASGACYFACTSNGSCTPTDGGQPLGNCCAQSGSIHFCDAVGTP